MKFAFQEENHIYTIDGERIPSVTQVISEIFPTQAMMFASPEEMYRGKYVHKACELYDMGSLNYEALFPEYRPYIDAYIEFREKTDYHFQYIETALYHPIYRYAGTLDRALPLLDIKTGGDFEPVQLGAYRELLLANHIVCPDEGLILYVTNKGKFKLQVIKNLKQYGLIFLSALTIFRYKAQKGDAKW